MYRMYSVCLANKERSGRERRYHKHSESVKKDAETKGDKKVENGEEDGAVDFVDLSSQAEKKKIE